MKTQKVTGVLPSTTERKKGPRCGVKDPRDSKTRILFTGVNLDPRLLPLESELNHQLHGRFPLTTGL